MLTRQLALDREQLKQRFPLGYALLFIRSRELFEVHQDSPGLQVNWRDVEVLEHTRDRLVVMLPEITLPKGKISRDRATIIGIPGRAALVGIETSTGTIISVVVEALETRQDGLLALIGIEERMKN